MRAVCVRLLKCELPPFIRLFATATPNGSPSAKYRDLVEKGKLEVDPSQLLVLEQLDRLHAQLEARGQTTPKVQANGNKWLSKLFGGDKVVSSPKGLYLFGAVGRGKTMLMDMFFDCCDFEPRRNRTHFNEFMLDIHKRIHELKSAHREVIDPIPPIVNSIIASNAILCFDEFQVTDIADAMILKRLFTHLFDRGLVVVCTSNRHPDELYKHGIQRSQFLPFISVLKSYCSCVYLDSHIDYRMKHSSMSSQRYFRTGKCDSESLMDIMFKQLASQENDVYHSSISFPLNDVYIEVIRPRTLQVLNRNVNVQKACGRVLDAQFSELCSKALGALDYLALSRVFHTVLLRNVPHFDASNLSQARRFITLIDTFYDTKVRLVISSVCDANQLFELGNEGGEQNLSDVQRLLMDDLNINSSHSGEESSANVFTGQEELFAFDRVVSRIAHMQTDEYWTHRQPTS